VLEQPIVAAIEAASITTNEVRFILGKGSFLLTCLRN
jgi:hypothetical protein